jgi:hypothetical protein
MIDSLEGEIEPRGDRLRVRLRLCRGIYVVDAFRETFKLTAAIGPALLRMREFLPREFRDHPEVQREVFDPIAEIWQHRLRFGP